MDKIKIIIRKDWAEVFKNRMVLFSVLFLPLLFTALPLIFLYTTRDAAISEASAELPAQFRKICPSELTGGECFQVFMAYQMMLLFMMIPLIIPVNIAAYSIVGEKTTRSLEPLLATPISTLELVIGKNLAASIPAVLATWLGFLLYILGAFLIVQKMTIIKALIDPLWLLAVILVGPLMAILSTNFSIMVSSRVNDPRVAEQLSAVVIVPLLGLMFGQFSGLFFINRTIILWTAIVLAALDAGIFYLAIRLFERENILTRWK